MAENEEDPFAVSNEPDNEGEEPEEQSEEEHDDGLRAVASSMVASWSYDRAAEQIQVFFNNGHEESYACTPDQWEEAKVAVSPGRWMHQNVLQ